MHAGGKCGVGLSLQAYIVREMNEIGVVCSDATRCNHTLFEREMRGMRRHTESIDYQRLYTSKCRKSLFGEKTCVGDVSQWSEPISEDSEASVRDRNRHDLYSCYDEGFKWANFV